MDRKMTSPHSSNFLIFFSTTNWLLQTFDCCWPTSYSSSIWTLRNSRAMLLYLHLFLMVHILYGRLRSAKPWKVQNISLEVFYHKSSIPHPQVLEAHNSSSTLRFFFPFQHTYPLVVILSQFGLFESTWF